MEPRDISIETLLAPSESDGRGRKSSLQMLRNAFANAMPDAKNAADIIGKLTTRFRNGTCHVYLNTEEPQRIGIIGLQSMQTLNQQLRKFGLPPVPLAMPTRPRHGRRTTTMIDVTYCSPLRQHSLTEKIR